MSAYDYNLKGKNREGLKTLGNVDTIKAKYLTI